MAYRVPVLHKFAFQDPIEGIVNEPTLVTKGTRYIVGSAPTGSFATFSAGQVVWADSDGHWTADTPLSGWHLFNKSDGSYYTYSSNTWSNSTAVKDLTINGNISSANQETIWNLKDNDAHALSFDAPGKTGILNFDTTDNAEKVTMSGGLDVAGNVVIHGGLNVQGEVTYLQTTNTEIKDKVITLNKDGIASSAGGSGIEFEEAGAITGYIQVSSDRSGYVFVAPNTTSALTIKATAESALTMGGNLVVEAASNINQDVTTDATPTFAGVQVTGAGSFGGNVTITGTLGAGATTVASLDSTGNATVGGTLGVTGKATLSGGADVTGNVAVTGDISAVNGSFSGTLGATGAATFGSTIAVTGAATFSSTIGVTGDATFSANITDGTNSVTVANIKKSYDSRAKYDAALGCVVFDDAVLDVA